MLNPFSYINLILFWCFVPQEATRLNHEFNCLAWNTRHLTNNELFYWINFLACLWEACTSLGCCWTVLIILFLVPAFKPFLNSSMTNALPQLPHGNGKYHTMNNTNIDDTHKYRKDFRKDFTHLKRRHMINKTFRLHVSYQSRERECRPTRRSCTLSYVRILLIGRHITARTLSVTTHSITCEFSWLIST